MKTGIELIATERQEQIDKHGFDQAHDQRHYFGQLKDAAISVLTYESSEWPSGWEPGMFWHIVGKPEIEVLVIAAAFCAAEIDRLQNLKKNKKRMG